MPDEISDGQEIQHPPGPQMKSRDRDKDTLKLPPATDEHILRALIGRPLHNRPADMVKIRRAG